MRVEADVQTVSFIAEHGGRVYVWADADGLKHVSTEAPKSHQAAPFERIAAHGFALYFATDMARPKTWNVILRHLPWRHLDVLWDGDQPGRASLVDGAPFPI